MLDKKKVAESFSKSAKIYNSHAKLQKGIITELLKKLPSSAKNILDIGSGTGLFEPILAKKYRKAKIIGIDIAPGMISYAKKKNTNSRVHFNIGDGESFSFKNRKFDLIVSASSIQWMNHKKVFKCAKRALSKDGIFCFATFGPKTLIELKKAGFSVNTFPNKDELVLALKKLFKKISFSQQTIIEQYKNLPALLKYLKKIGAHTSEKTKSGDKSKIKLALKKSKTGFNATFQVYYFVAKPSPDFRKFAI